MLLRSYKWPTDDLSIRCIPTVDDSCVYVINPLRNMELRRLPKHLDLMESW